MTRWFRFYDDAINDPKVLRLSDSLHRIWVGLLCIASKHKGILPTIEDCALMLRMKVEKVRDAMTELAGRGLLDTDGTTWVPHNWNERQYQSDVSTERVKRFRQRSRNGGETSPDTEQNRNNTSSVDRRGSLATAPNGGALRSPLRKLNDIPAASPELAASLTKKGALQ